MRGRRLLLAGIGVVALALAAGCGGAGDDNDASTHTSATGEGAVEQAGPGGVGAPGRSDGDQATNSGGAGTVPPGASIDRKIVFRSSMELAVEDVVASFDRAGSIARDAGGFVEKSSLSNSGDSGERKSASLTLRVPVAQYDGVLASLRALPGSTVHREGAQATEVTEQYTDLQSRLRNLERVEAQYLDLLAKAVTIQDILTVTDRLNGVRLEIEQTQGRIQVLDDLTEMASIDLMLFTAGARVDGNGGGPKGFAEAFADAWDAALEAVRYLASGAAVATVALIWLGIPLVTVAVAARWLSKRGRTAASS